MYAKLAMFAFKSVAGAGVGSIVSNAIKMTTPVKTKWLEKAAIAIGGVVLSSLIGDECDKFITRTIDGIKPKKKVIHKRKLRKYDSIHRNQ